MLFGQSTPHGHHHKKDPLLLLSCPCIPRKRDEIFFNTFRSQWYRNAILWGFIHRLALRKCTEMGFYEGLFIAIFEDFDSFEIGLVRVSYSLTEFLNISSMSPQLFNYVTFLVLLHNY
jgi:hypothetical protein